MSAARLARRFIKKSPENLALKGFLRYQWLFLLVSMRKQNG
jgi:hypothetical protein